jgi:acyl-coenzyme A thioesterase PaaI-like protein
MKNLTILSIIFIMCSVLLACDENEIMPSYQTKGTTTATVASIAASNTAPLAGQSITLTMDFVNPASDPVNTVVLRARVGSGSFVDIQSFDEQSAAKDVEISHEVNYVTPSTPGTVTFEMEISSQKEYPQKRRVSISVK